MLQPKLDEVMKRIAGACKISGRSAEEITLILVTKGVSNQLIQEAYQLGLRQFGENRVQEWLGKKEELPRDIRWHFIGHLQTNKAKYCVGETELIHSVDSVKLAQALDSEARSKNVTVSCLLQVNTSGEETKYGIDREQLSPLVLEIKRFPNLRIQGLMTIGPLTEDVVRIRSAFGNLRQLRDEMKKEFPALDWKYLSMGMSSDFEIAIEEGANLLRIGSAVFGERNKP